jgi:hypothetical protein
MVTGHYFAKSYNAQAELEPFFMLSASLRQELFDKRLSVTLQGRNLLQSSNIDITTSGTNYRSNILVKQEIPIISLMLSYNFNNFKRQKQTETIDVGPGL